MNASTSPLPASDQTLRGILLICAAVFLFASHDGLSKFLSGFYPIVMVVWARYLVHTLLMVAVFVPRNGLAVIRSRRPLMQLARALCLIGTSLFFTTGLRYLPLAEATAVNFLAPLLVTALSVPLLKEKVSLGQWLAVLTGFIGVLPWCPDPPMNASTSPLPASDQTLRGILLICAAVFLFASHDGLSKFLSGFYPIVMVVWARYLVHTLLMVAVFVPRNGLAVIRSRRPLMQLARALCLIGTSLFFTTGLRYLPLAEATAVNFLAPLLVTALSVPLLKEKVSLGQWLAVLTGFIGVLPWCPDPPMNASTSPLPASDQTLRGILLICAAVFLFASH
ncbi:DMT family transporter, partial [Pseudomonas aeruginosa]